MAYVVRTTDNAGDNGRAADQNQSVNNDIYFKAYTVNPAYGCRVSNTVVQTIGTGAWTTLTFDAERYDTGTYHSLIGNTDRLTADVAGYYFIYANVGWEVNAAGERGLKIVESTGSTAIAYVMNTGVLALQVPFQAVSTVWYLGAAAYVYCQVFQNSGGDLDTYKVTSASPEFGMFRCHV